MTWIVRNCLDDLKVIYMYHVSVIYIFVYLYMTRIVRNCPIFKKYYICIMCLSLYNQYEVYRGYIVFAFSVIMFVCLSVCKLFSVSRFLSTYLG